MVESPLHHYSLELHKTQKAVRHVPFGLLLRKKKKKSSTPALRLERQQHTHMTVCPLEEHTHNDCMPQTHDTNRVDTHSKSPLLELAVSLCMTHKHTVYPRIWVRHLLGFKSAPLYCVYR